MATFHLVLGWLLGLVWLHRLLDIGLGMRQVADIARPEWDRRPEPAPRVTIIVPARNEEEHVETALGSLLELEYENYEVIAVNDRSTDATGVILDRLATASAGRLRTLHITALPPGWLGKNHAMWKAAAMATGDWLLFTDADVVFRPDALRRAMAYSLAEKADHLVVFPEVHLHTVGERMMTAFFMSLFIFGHRPWKVADPRTRDHMGVGAFNLVRRSTYDAIGTHEALRLEVIDDMKLGKLIKQGGFAQRNVIGPGLISLRWAHGAMGVVRNLTKNMFALMLFRWPRTLGAAFLLLLLNIGPFAGVPLATGWSRLGYVVAVAAIAALYARMAPPLGVNPLYFLLHPVAGLLFAYTLLRSAFHAWRHGGVIWRDTKYSLDELRRGLV
ncbi:MAG TPA: glycosyltransferase family 2 protein [Terriglobales bacterium]|nr:glycosyltransferase family 2 protein [Terriglobales bacterium]